ncbi:MAG: hypothetical protein J0H68_01745 [Sphingobacteriia bacterium]|nr:hypothetical protein [Sphingobacteriia bacterium]
MTKRNKNTLKSKTKLFFKEAFHLLLLLTLPSLACYCVTMLGGHLFFSVKSLSESAISYFNTGSNNRKTFETAIEKGSDLVKKVLV